MHAPRHQSQIHRLRFVLRQARETLEHMRYGQDEQALLRCLSSIDVILSEQEGDDCGSCRRNQERADKYIEEAMNQRYRARSASRLAGKIEEKRQQVLAENKKLRQKIKAMKRS